MSIHFNFIVDDVDAENIMDCISSEICRLRERAGRIRLIENDYYTADAMDGYADYLQTLKSKMTNERIED